jgi:flagellar motor switch protein FliM
MDEQLSEQNEGTAAAAGEGETATLAGRYDFGDAQRLSAGQLRQLQQVHERFSRELATSLSALTRRAVKANAVSCRQAETDTARQQLVQSGLLIVLDVHPLEAHVSMGMDSRVVFPLLEALLGGRVAGSADVERELTEIELSVLQDLHAVVIRELERAWRPAARFTFQVMAQQTDPSAARPRPSPEGSLVATLDLEVEGNSGRITLLYPLRVGREIQGGDVAGAAADAARRPEMMQQALFERLRSAVLVVEGRLEGATLRLRDLADLRAGDLLCLDIPLEDPLDITVNGASRFWGRLTDSGRKKGIRIHEVLPSKAGERWSR